MKKLLTLAAAGILFTGIGTSQLAAAETTGSDTEQAVKKEQEIKRGKRNGRRPPRWNRERYGQKNNADADQTGSESVKKRPAGKFNPRMLCPCCRFHLMQMRKDSAGFRAPGRRMENFEKSGMGKNRTGKRPFVRRGQKPVQPAAEAEQE